MKDFTLFIAPFLLMIAFPFAMYLLISWAQRREEEENAKNRMQAYVWTVLQSIEGSPDYSMLCLKFLIILKSKHSLQDLEEFYKKVKVAKLLHDRSTVEDLIRDLDRKKQAPDVPVKKTVKISDLLGLGNDFNQTELKRAYRSWMMKNHPDKNPKTNLETVQKVTAWYNRNKS